MEEREFRVIGQRCESQAKPARFRNRSWKPCPDDRISRSSCWFDGPPKDHASALVLVLESPHADEFKDPAMPRAASGATGKAIRDLLPTVVKTSGFPISGQVPVYVMNAIRFQCSLGRSDRTVRDCVFRSCWERKDVSDDFKRRLLTKLIEVGGQSVVINACTSGPRGQRRRGVEEAILDVRDRHPFVYFRLEHPSNWYRRLRDRNDGKHPFREEDRYQWKTDHQ